MNILELNQQKHGLNLAFTLYWNWNHDGLY